MSVLSTVQTAAQLKLLRVPLHLTHEQTMVCNRLFAAQVCVLRLVAAEGISDATPKGASAFLLRHRAELEPFLRENRTETVNLLRRLVVELATCPPTTLRQRIRGLPRVVSGSLTLPIRGLGRIDIRASVTAMAERSQGAKLLAEFDLIHEGSSITAELRFWGKPPKLRQVLQQSRAAKLAVSKSAKNGTVNTQSTLAKRLRVEPAALATPREHASPERVRPKKGRGSNQDRHAITVIRRTGNTAIPPSTALGVKRPAQNFPLDREAVAIVSVNCSCGGDNPTCFRCDGRGYYDRPGALSITSATTRLVTSVSIVGLAKDARGASHAVREHGRFLSNAEHDSYDDESGA